MSERCDKRDGRRIRPLRAGIAGAAEPGRRLTTAPGGRGRGAPSRRRDGCVVSGTRRQRRPVLPGAAARVRRGAVWEWAAPPPARESTSTTGPEPVGAPADR